MKNGNWKGFGVEFLSVFVAVVSAFALNNWNDNRKADNSEQKILSEISNGLNQDTYDLDLNMKGHRQGMEACSYFKKVFTGQVVSSDSLLYHYVNLTRDFVSIQNNAGYETLKSKGLELIKNDSLRLQIISLYEYDYSTLYKLEEKYAEIQFHTSYFKEINDVLAPIFLIDTLGNITGINTPFVLEESQRNKMLAYLLKIEFNRSFILQFYTQIKQKIIDVREQINRELQN
jgi:hypothetical protein